MGRSIRGLIGIDPWQGKTIEGELMIRTVIHIDEDKCTGCGLCANACHEGAIGIVDGKAKLLRDDFCDGMGDCLPSCPTGAITFVEREALPYDEAAVVAAQTAKAHAVHTGQSGSGDLGGGCPGSRAQMLHTPEKTQSSPEAEAQSQLAQWPCQIKLMPLQSPYYQGADLLIAADCTAFSYASFHERYMRGKVTIVGCPKLDAIDYTEKLSAIIAMNDIRSVTVCRMEVPCCGGLQRAVENALDASGKKLPFEVVTFSVRGEVL